MKNILRKSIVAVCCCTMLVACDDFLTELPEAARSTNNFYQTEADFENAVVGLYATLKHNGLYGNGGPSGSLLHLTEIVSDNAEIGSTKNTATLSWFEIDEFNISLSNTVVSNAWIGHYIGIGRANAVLENLPGADFDEAARARFEAEAKFMRAYFYFNLVRLFGDVPLVDKTINDPYGAKNLTRTSADIIYGFILSDLSFAENNLPEVIPAGEAGRASKWAAKALLGKVYLTMNQPELAASKLKEIIDANVYDLTSVSYEQLFSPETSYDSNKGMIWAVHYKSGLVGQGSALWSSYIPWGASGTLYGTTSTGEGFMKPTQDLINAYEEGDIRKDASLKTSFITANGDVVNEPFVYKYHQLGPQAGDADTDLPLLRYADVVLMYAEALNELGQTTEAEPYLNLVRARAGLPEKVGLSQAEMKLAIEEERRVEFAFEGHRWFDLVRTNRYLEVMGDKGYLVQSFHNLYPIPQRETELVAIGQNPGY